MADGVGADAPTGALPEVRIKRVYDPISADDGQRILVDRLWPRGLSKAKAGIDLWLRDVAPSTALRRWFDHKPDRWDEFRMRYWDELTFCPAIADLKARVRGGPTTLLYSAHDQLHNQAVVLQRFLSGAGRGAGPGLSESRQ